MANAASVCGSTWIAMRSIRQHYRQFRNRCRFWLLPPAFLGGRFDAVWPATSPGFPSSEFDPGRDSRDVSLNLLGWLVEYVLLKAANALSESSERALRLEAITRSIIVLVFPPRVLPHAGSASGRFHHEEDEPH